MCVDQIDRCLTNGDIVDVSTCYDPQPPAAPVSHELKTIGNCVGTDDEFVGHLEDIVSGGRRHDVTVRPFEDPYAELLLQGSDIAAKCGLADPQSRGGPAEVPVLSQDDGVLQQFQVHIHSRTVSFLRLLCIGIQTKFAPD